MKRLNRMILSCCIAFTSLPVVAQVNDAFSDFEDKGSVITEFLTSGYFAVIVVTVAFIGASILMLMKKIDFMGWITILGGGVLLGNAPSLAEWVLS